MMLTTSLKMLISSYTIIQVNELKKLHVLIQFFLKSLIKQLKWNFQKGNSHLIKKLTLQNKIH